MNCDLDHSQQTGKFCKKCGTELATAYRACQNGHPLNPGQNFCSQCGSSAAATPTPVAPPTPTYTPPYTPPTFQQPKPTNGMSIAGFVLSLLCCTALPGLILSVVGLNQIKNNPNQQGRGLAIAGLVLGILGTIFWVVWFFIQVVFNAYLFQ
jgi:hypothetical protein